MDFLNHKKLERQQKVIERNQKIIDGLVDRVQQDEHELAYMREEQAPGPKFDTSVQDAAAAREQSAHRGSAVNGER